MRCQCSAFHLMRASSRLRTIFGGANRVETQPISFVTGKEAPSLLITARRDRLVNSDNSRRMAAKIRARGGVTEERTYLGVGHLTLIGAFAPKHYVAHSFTSAKTRLFTIVSCQATGRDCPLLNNCPNMIRDANIIDPLFSKRECGSLVMESTQACESSLIAVLPQSSLYPHW